MPGDLVARHAAVMRRQNAEPQDGTAQHGGRLLRASQGDREACAGEQDRDGERSGGQPELIAARDARIEGQHGDEMRGPDADTAGQAATPIHTARMRPWLCPAWANRLMAEKVASMQMQTARPTSTMSCWLTKHL